MDGPSVRDQERSIDWGVILLQVGGKDLRGAYFKEWEELTSRGEDNRQSYMGITLVFGSHGDLSGRMPTQGGPAIPTG